MEVCFDSERISLCSLGAQLASAPPYGHTVLQCAERYTRNRSFSRAARECSELSKRMEQTAFERSGSKRLAVNDGRQRMEAISGCSTRKARLVCTRPALAYH